MSEHTAPANWRELLAELRKLTALIGPLQAILAQEANPGVQDRIDIFIAEILEWAVANLEADQHTRLAVHQLARLFKQQEQEMAAMSQKLDQVLLLLDGEMDSDGENPGHR